MKHLIKKIVVSAREQRGETLVEILIALTLLAVVGVTFMLAISSGYITLASIEKKVNVDNLARAQLEYTKNCQYDPNTPPTYQTIDQLGPGDPYAITLPQGYAIDVTATPAHGSEDGVQQITVTILRDGVTLLLLDDFKVDR